jgi:hypothetical protein
MKNKRYELNESNLFDDANTSEKFSGPPALWERLKRYCKSAGIKYSKFVCAAILEKLNREDFEN